MQIAHQAYATAFSQISLFLALFWSIFPAKIDTPFRMCANPYYDNDKKKKKVNAIETSEILFSCLRFLVSDLQDLFYSQNSRG